MQNSKIQLIKKILFIILLIILFVGPAYLISKRGRQSELRHSSASVLENNHDFLVFSVSEISATSSRFKIRVSIMPHSGTTPTNLVLTNTSGAKLNLQLEEVNFPYECHDSHDGSSERVGYETSWTGGNPEDYLTSDLEVLMVASDGNVSTVSKSIAHICTRLSEDVGEVSSGGESIFPDVE